MSKNDQGSGLIESFMNKQGQYRPTLLALYNKLINSPWLKKTWLPLLLAGVCFLLTLVPVSQNILKCKTCSPILASAGEELVITGIINDKANKTLLELKLEPTQVVNVHFDNARLDENTVSMLGYFSAATPTFPQPIDFRPRKNSGSKISVKVILKSPSVIPNALHLFREAALNTRQPDFKMRADGVGLIFEISQESNDENIATEDYSDLVIGDQPYKVTDIPILIIPENNADIAFRFALNDWDPKLQPNLFAFSGLNEKDRHISAQGLAVSTLVGGDQLFGSLLCAAPGNEKILWLESRKFRGGACPSKNQFATLKLRSLSIREEGLQISASGHAWAKIQDELAYSVIDYWEDKIKHNPFLNQPFKQ